ncbi:MAG TPA: MASE4 domain-containing protein [Pseudolabrys sp.]|nr:MASE4 domain-containing protein [Pseudolabrys sp.]
MTARTLWDASKVSLATLQPTVQQRRATFVVAAVVLIAAAAIAPFGAIQLRPTDGFIPATQSVLVICDLLIATLLASQAMTIGSRGLLLLAGGFLFEALIIVSHLLTFPGAFAPAGLLGAGLQTTAWLYILWHLGLPAAVIGYVCVPRASRVLTAKVVCSDAIVVVGLVAVLTWLVTSYGDFLPALFIDRQGFTPLANIVTGFDLVVSVVALVALLARRRKSVLDLWLVVAMVTLVAELFITSFVIGSRFSAGFYAGRLLSLAASILVLIALLAETVQHSSRLARANLALQLERSRKLTSLDAAIGAIAHEVKQPITAIALNSGAVQMMLNSPAPDLEKVRETAEAIQESTIRANEIFTSIRGLFSESHADMQQVDVNAVVSDIIRGLGGDLHEYHVVPRIELEPQLPTILGHKGQLQEVIFNLVHNALDAMNTSSRSERTLHVRTEKRGSNAIRISVRDSGPGIEPGQVERIFDPFVTTKKGGMGMGLAICRMIVERHGGQLSASADTSAGAHFDVVLPIKPAADVHRQSAEDPIATVYPQLLLRDLPAIRARTDAKVESAKLS